MHEPPVPTNEEPRLATLRALDVLDTPAEERFDRITRLAASVFDVPIALVSLVDERRQWFKSCVGLDVDETPRSISFCGHAINRPTPLVVEDALADPRFTDNPLVIGPPGIRCYVGMPLDGGNGLLVGTLCIIDTRARSVDDRDLQILRGFADLVEAELRAIGEEAAARVRAHGDEALRRTKDLYRAVVAAMSDGVVVQDRGGAIIGHNGAALDLLGLTADQLTGRTSTDPRWRSIRPDGSPLPGGEHPAMETLATGERRVGVVMGVHSPDLKLRWLSVTTDPLVNRDGDRWGVVSVFTDITGQRETERAKREFLSVISHELRTPLTAIRGSLGLLASGRIGLEDAPGRQMLEIAVDNSERLTRLISDLLDLERIENGKVDLARQETSVQELLEVARSSAVGLATVEGLRIEVAGMDASVWIDRDRIAQVMANLISNAVKFSPAGTVLRLEAEVDGDEVEIRVIDQGRGIPADKLETIFERFEQVDASDSRDRGGTGIGLAICRSLVQQHGGRIWAESSPGQGTTLAFRLPVLVDDPIPEAQHHHEPVAVESPEPVDVPVAASGATDRSSVPAGAAGP